MSGRPDLRRGRKPESATTHGNFVVDFGGSNMTPINDNILWPVYDARDGSSIGRMRMSDIFRKMF